LPREPDYRNRIGFSFVSRNFTNFDENITYPSTFSSSESSGANYSFNYFKSTFSSTGSLGFTKLPIEEADMDFFKVGAPACYLRDNNGETSLYLSSFSGILVFTLACKAPPRYYTLNSFLS
jgi:hypothetical protein